jgi:hypothetical protein
VFVYASVLGALLAWRFFRAFGSRGWLIVGAEQKSHAVAKEKT